MTAAGIAKYTKKQQSRATNMQCFCIRDQKPFIIFLIAWKSGQENIADYFTKHHSTKNHKLVCPVYL